MKIVWTKDNATCGLKWGKLWFSLDLDDFKVGWVFIDGPTNKVVGKKYKLRASAKKAAEIYLRSNK